MGARGAIIMSFFGVMFASLTFALQTRWNGPLLFLPFILTVALSIMAIQTMRSPGNGIVPSRRATRVILWSSFGEGLGLFIVANVVINLGHPEILLPVMALVVGVHFLPTVFVPQSF